MKKIIFFLIIIFLLPVITFADAGPKPGMKFNFRYEILKNPDLISGQQIECKDINCNDTRSLQEAGPQRFECSSREYCFSQAYGYADFHKLVIIYSDKVRESNIFSTNNFNSSFQVLVRENDLLITETTIFNSNILGFLLALIITIILETIVTGIFFCKQKIPTRLILSVLIANLISLPSLWIFLAVVKPTLEIILIAELFIIIFEAFFINLLNRKTISLIRLGILSIVMNLVSGILGTFIFAFFQFFGLLS